VKMVVGLGNPGQRYARTPHNVGFQTVDCIAVELKCALRRAWRGNARYGEADMEGERLLLMQPLTYMNLSGEAVAPLARRKGLQPNDIIVALDDADLPLGQIRIRPAGGSGGHKGLKSILERLGTEQVARVRLGVGRSRNAEDLVAHVLARFAQDDMPKADAMIRRAANAIMEMLRNGIEKAMNLYNAAPETRQKKNADAVKEEHQNKGETHGKI